MLTTSNLEHNIKGADFNGCIEVVLSACETYAITLNFTTFSVRIIEYIPDTT